MRCYWLAGLAFLVCGCGLADYEKQMVLAQARQQRIEEDNQVLAVPVRIPYREEKGEKRPLADVSIRPPAGISLEPYNETAPRHNLLYSYRPQQGKSAGRFAAFELAIGEGDPKEFATAVLKAFSPNVPPAKKTQVYPPSWPAAEQPPPRIFATYEHEDEQFFYSVNIWDGKRSKVAIVYWVFRAQKDAARRAIQLSLESFIGEGEPTFRRGPLDTVPTAPP